MRTSDAVLTKRSTGSVAHLAPLARVAGLSYLLVIAGGLFAAVIVRGSLIVPGDAAATAQAITANQPLWRSGLAVHLLYLIPATLMNVLLYELFKRAHVMLARLGLVFSMVAVTIAAVSLLTLYGPLAMADEGAALAALGETQLHALAYLSVRLFSIGFAFSLVFFACFCALTGVLILRSRLLPRVIGGMMIAACVCYLVNSLAAILSPSLSNRLVPWILLPILLAELAMALWLVVKSINVEASVRPQAQAPGGVRS